MHLSKFLLLILLSFSLIKASFADVIYLKGNKQLFGQVMAINQNEIILEVISAADNVLEVRAFPLSPVQKIIDESGTILYQNEKARYSNLNSFYSLMETNWEELKFKTVAADTQHIIYRSGKTEQVKIVSITSDYVFLDTEDPDPKDHTINKLPLRNITSINGINVLLTNFNIPKRYLLSETKYPLYQVQIGFDYVTTQYSELQSLFQEFYDQNMINKLAAKRSDNYPGIFVKFELYMKPYLALGLSGQYYKGQKINTLNLTMVDIKYLYRTSLLHPWLSVGYAGHEFSSRETMADALYEWHNSSNALCLGAGINTGKELGLGFNFAVYYIPFGKGKTKIDIDNLDVTSEKEINFSMLKISFGMHFSFN